MNKTYVFCVICLTLLFSSLTYADLGIALGAKIGTLGYGAEITKSTIPKLNVRAGFATAAYSHEGEMTDQEVEYIGDLNFFPGRFRRTIIPGTDHSALALV